MLEIDKTTLEGVSRCVRVKVRFDVKIPIKKGMNIEISNKKSIWSPFKYERLQSFCFICGILGHMRRECDLIEGATEIRSIPEDKLPYGEWLRASPMKRTVISTAEPPKINTPSLRRTLFENFRRAAKAEFEEEPREDVSKVEPVAITKLRENLN